MAIHHFKLQGDFIELNVLLKLLMLAQSGGGAKVLIADGAVRVDGAVESRVRRKLREGSVVRVGDEEIRVLADTSPGDATTTRTPDDAAEPRPETGARKPAPTPRKRRAAATAPAGASPWTPTAGKPAR